MEQGCCWFLALGCLIAKNTYALSAAENASQKECKSFKPLKKKNLPQTQRCAFVLLYYILTGMFACTLIFYYYYSRHDSNLNLAFSDETMQNIPILATFFGHVKHSTFATPTLITRCLTLETHGSLNQVERTKFFSLFILHH